MPPTRNMKHVRNCGGLGLLAIMISVGVAVGLSSGGVLGTGVALGIGAAVLVVSCCMCCCVYTVCVNPYLEEFAGIERAASGAARDCYYDADHPPNWERLASDAGPLRGGKLDSGAFAEEYHSHIIEHLAFARKTLQEKAGCSRFVYFFGDSSLDNKHWLFNAAMAKTRQMDDEAIAGAAMNGWEHVLTSTMAKDVSYWMNRGAEERLGKAALCTVMTSIEESTVDDRETSRSGLLLQDAFVRDRITERDFLVVSVGGNDVALRPTLRTAVNMYMLVNSPACLIKCGCAPGFGYFRRLFAKRVMRVVSRVVSKRKPQAVLVCMLYYLDEEAGGSWADPVLQRLGYNSNPGKLQLIIRTLYASIVKEGLTIDGVQQVIPVPLFKVLDGKLHSDYLHRVEPSVSGGRKMAKAFLDIIAPMVTNDGAGAAGAGGAGAGVGAGASVRQGNSRGYGALA